MLRFTISCLVASSCRVLIAVMNKPKRRLDSLENYSKRIVLDVTKNSEFHFHSNRKYFWSVWCCRLESKVQITPSSLDVTKIAALKTKPNTNTHQHDGIFSGHPLPNNGTTFACLDVFFLIVSKELVVISRNRSDGWDSHVVVEYSHATYAMIKMKITKLNVHTESFVAFAQQSNPFMMKLVSNVHLFLLPPAR